MSPCIAVDLLFHIYVLNVKFDFQKMPIVLRYILHLPSLAKFIPRHDLFVYYSESRLEAFTQFLISFKI